MNNFSWYEVIKLPTWAPPSYIFGPVWTFLYLLIFVSFGKVFYFIFEGKIPQIFIVPLILNLILNASFSPVQFELKNYLAASIIIFFMIITLLWGMIGLYKYDKLFTLLNIPYLLWICFAFVLQLNITILNWKS